MQLKRGQAHNELTRFRYDAWLQIGVQDVSVSTLRRVWQEGQDTLEQIRQELAACTEGEMQVVGVPNARLWQEVRTLALLEAEDAPATVGALRAILREEGECGVDPEAWWHLGEALGYQVEVSWAQNAGEYDVRFVRASQRALLPVQPEKTVTVHRGTWRGYGNAPLQGKLVHKLVPQVRAFLQERLPESMIPSALVLLEALPLTPNGKVDRRKLPAPEQSRVELTSAFVAPRTPVEDILSQQIAEVLGIEQVGIHDDFFELGGHSLLATQVLSRVRDSFQVEMSLSHFFGAPTAAGLASGVEQERRGEQELVLGRMSRVEEIPLSFAQERLWFLDQLAPDNAFYNLPLVMRLEGRLQRQALEQSVHALLQRHEALRTSFPLHNGEPYQHVTAHLKLDIPLFDLRRLPGRGSRCEIHHLDLRGDAELV